MNMKSCCTLLAGLVAAFGLSATVAAEPGEPAPGDTLGGQIFAVKVHILYSTLPDFPAGTDFDNCYTFHEDGSWTDPLFPDSSAPVSGAWVQHTELPASTYTAVVGDLAPGVILIQTGTVTPGRGAGIRRLTAYTSTFLNGHELAFEGVSYGRAVATCPFF